MKILVFGNEKLVQDNMALKISEKIKIPGVEFEHILNPEKILYEEKDIVIMDTVSSLPEPRIIDDISGISASSISTLHDYDLGFAIKMREKLGRKGKVKIIGLPQSGDEAGIRKETEKLIQSLL